MFKFKLLSPEAIPAALARIERYRLLNEPKCAESICRDILAIDPGNKQAAIDLVLSLTDQLPVSMDFREAQDTAAGFEDKYDQAYYSGIVRERRAHATLGRGNPGSGTIAWHLLREAMKFYEAAEKLRPPGNDDAIIRWNTCARVILQHDSVKPDDHVATPIELE